MLRLVNLGKSYGESWAVRGVSLDIADGELLALVGESGCGKTTTLKMVNRLVEPSEGRVLVAGEDGAQLDPIALRRRIGYVFQGIGLFPHWTVAENVAAVLQLLNWNRERTRARVDELLDLVGLPPAEYRNRLPAQLSGGQRQRVGLARALAAQPSLLLMDEPLGALDPITRDGLQQELGRLHRELKLTIVLVTHDLTEALLLADRIAVMRAGRIVALGSPAELLADPQDEYAAQLLATPRRQAEQIELLGGTDALLRGNSCGEENTGGGARATT